MFKRAVDVLAALFGLLALAPLFALLAVAIKLDSPGPVFYRQERVGRHGRPFRIFKFRTMGVVQQAGAAEITAAGDDRITVGGGPGTTYRPTDVRSVCGAPVVRA